MKLTTFLSLYKTKRSDEERVELIQARIRDVYVPIDKKRKMAETVINKSCLDSAGNVHIDSVKKYMLSLLSLVDLYTDFEYKASEDFDKFNEHGIFGAIFELVDEREIKEYNMIIDMVMSDLVTNK